MGLLNQLLRIHDKAFHIEKVVLASRCEGKVSDKAQTVSCDCTQWNQVLDSFLNNAQKNAQKKLRWQEVLDLTH